MHLGRTTLSKFLIQQLKGIEGASDLGALLVDVAAAVKAIAAMTAKGALGGALGVGGATNAQGEAQKRLDVLADETLIRSCEWGGLVAGMASEENDAPIAVPAEFERGRFLLVFDPLDGSSNIDVNVSVGTIFSVLRCPEGVTTPADEHFLQAGSAQVAAGYCVYGPQTTLVLTVGHGTHAFTLDREVGSFVLTTRGMKIPEETKEFAVNMSNQRFWEAPMQAYVGDLLAGKEGPRGKDFNMRWIASMVADVHRILTRGGIFSYPLDSKCAPKGGKLRLMYEANPMALLVEQAGGAASTGRQRMLDVQPTGLHMRVPVFLGSKQEVEAAVQYHHRHGAA